MNKLKHVLEAQQFDRELLEEVFKIADEMRQIDFSDILKNRIMASLFYEPSTRTRFSFETAMIKLGGNIITTENATEFSSVAKGETVEDTIKTLNNYVDIIVMRHFEEGSAKKAASVSKTPIINAGDGKGQHPTQSLLDLYTIKNKFGKIDNLKIAMVGDLKNGRTVRSLSYLLTRFNNIKIFFVAPAVCKMRNDILEYLDKKNVEWQEENDLNKVLPEVDVVYMTRIQKERFQKNLDDYNKAKGKYIIDSSNIKLMPENSILMHPLPRVDEISVDVDSDKRAIYFEQAKNGLYIRMALLKMLLS